MHVRSVRRPVRRRPLTRPPAGSKWAPLRSTRSRAPTSTAVPVVFDGLVFEGVSGGSAELGDEADRYDFQGSFALLDATSGALVKKTWTIHSPDTHDDFAGAGIWSTPAVDADTKYAYVGTANPFKPQAEHPNANSVVKIDLDPPGRRSARSSALQGQGRRVPRQRGLPC